MLFTAVIVATPTNSHEDYIANSLQSGKAVFTEKPVAEESEAVDRVYKIAKKVSKPLFCAFNRRFDPSFDAVYRQVRAGQLGQVHQIKLTSRDSPLPSEAYLKISGGIFHDCMVHDIDLMTYVLGEYPVEVFTVANGQIPEIAAMNDYDNVVSTFKFKSGMVVTVFSVKLQSKHYHFKSTIRYYLLTYKHFNKLRHHWHGRPQPLGLIWLRSTFGSFWTKRNATSCQRSTQLLRTYYKSRGFKVRSIILSLKKNFLLFS